MNTSSPFFERRVLFEAGTAGYQIYRIPAIAVTPRNTVLAFCAARFAPGDWSQIDIAMRRSSNGGETWEPMQIIASEGQSTVDNPVPIVDRITGSIHFLHQVNYERCYYLRSDDEGQTFSPSREITATFEQFRPEYDWHVLAPGPGHGLQMDNGRLVVPVWLSTGEGTEFGPGKRGHRPSIVATIYSDDHGATWQRGEIVCWHTPETPNPSETIAEQLADGRVMLNIRSESPRNRRLVSYSRDGAIGWSNPSFQEDLFEPVCFGSLIRLSKPDPQGHSYLLFSNPDSHANPVVVGGWARRRENLTVKLSNDEGETWSVVKVLDSGIAGYSDLGVGPDGTIYCLYEGGGIDGNIFHNSHLSVIRFNIAWLTDEVGSMR